MTASQLNSQSFNRKRQVLQTRMATLVMLAIIALSGVIVLAWFAGEGTISGIFAQLQFLQEHPPLWIEVPMVVGEYLLAPTVVLFLLAIAIMKVSPQPQAWSRIIVVGILLALTIRYLLWRSLTTLNLADPLNGVFSLGLFFLELLVLIGSIIQLLLMLRLKDRRREADQMAIAVLQGIFTPSVDILVPTYGEPMFILRRTIIGCQVLEYAHKSIYLLDDTRRPEVQALAEELGCQYITRPDNRDAKAGNLNHAIAQTHGDLIVVFDADFVPTKNFLLRTVGFFQNKNVALVQTPQSFYNSDPIARNLGLEDVLTPEEEVFYRQIQPLRDGVGSAVCAGTSFVVRRSALKEVGGFVTGSLSEDYFTGIRLSAQGYRLIYLDEKLSAGLAADNMADQAAQRVRWARGTLQAFFIDANPLTIPGLSPLQRLAHLEGLFHWFTSLSRVGFLIIPLAYAFLGVIPLRATEVEVLYFFLPYYLVQLTVFSWLNYRSRSALLSDIYSLALAFPLALTAIQVMLNPFARSFKVTPKGTSRDHFSFNWMIAWPLIIVFIATAVSLWRNLGICLTAASQSGAAFDVVEHLEGLGLGWIWSAYNLIMISVTLLILLDIPKLDPYEWFNLRRVVQLNAAGKTWWGITTMISEVGAQVVLTQAGLSSSIALGEMLPVTLQIAEEKLELQGKIVSTGFLDEFPTVQVTFERVDSRQQRSLVEMLYCRPGQWQRRETPGEFRSIWLLFKVLLMPQALFGRAMQVRPTTVSKV